MFREFNALSRVSNHINRNIDQDRSGNDGDIEILNINSPDYNTQDSDPNESSLNEAWRFISAVRHHNLTHNGGDQRNLTHYDNLVTNKRHEDIKHYNSYKNTTFCNETAKHRKYGRNLSFPTINDYLNALDDSSDEDAPSIIEQNYFNIEHAPHEAVEIYDGTIYAVANEGPMLIYSYKNRNCASDDNEVLINSPNQESQTNSTSSISVEHLNEESVNYEKSFYTFSTSFHPVIVPRLPLATYILPTVTEILESNRQSPKITEISCEDNEIKRKPSNSWVINDNDSSNSGNTTETNVDNSGDDESLSDNRKQSLDLLNDTISNQSETYDNSKMPCDLSLKENVTFSLISSGGPIGNTIGNKGMLKRDNYNQDANEVAQVDSASNNIENYSSKSKPINSSIELSEHSSIPTLHLSLNTEANTIEQSWFKRFLKYILCCRK